MIKLFYSYSHKDESFRNELEKQLTMLKRTNFIESWHDRRIQAGQEIDNQINRNLKEAKIILLLVSPDFLASDYCYDREMEEAMRRHEAKESVVIPVILRPCDWHDALFGKLLAAPTDGRPVTSFGKRDAAFLDITRSIKKVIKSLGSAVVPRATSSTGPASNANIATTGTSVAFTEHRPHSSSEHAPTSHYVIIVNGKEVGGEFPTQKAAIDYACKTGYKPVHVARQRHLQDRSQPAHWRVCPC